MLNINEHIRIPDTELEWQAIRAQGAGGQNVNKVASAVHLRFNLAASSLPDEVKSAVFQCRDRRLTRDGVIVIKAQRYRSQEKNLEDARQRLATLIARAIQPRKPRKATRPTLGAKKRRLESKTQRGRTKALRKPPQAE